MLSLEPSIKRGLTFWDRALMPADEFYERVRLTRAEMRACGLQALVVSGNMYEDADLIYLVGGNVDGTMVLTLDGEPEIFTVSGSRESFFLRELTWVENVSHQGALVGESVRAALVRKGVETGRIGTAGLQLLPARQYDDLLGSLSAYEVRDFGPSLEKLRGLLRPRERAALDIANGITTKAVAAAEALFAKGGSNADAVVEAERVARLEGAWDFRALANLGADELRPYERPSDERREPLLLWVATRYQGYWADQVGKGGAPGGSEAAQALAAMTAAAKAGITGGEVASAGLAALSQRSRPLALSYGLGRAIGIALNGAPASIRRPRRDCWKGWCCLSMFSPPVAAERLSPRRSSRSGRTACARSDRRMTMILRQWAEEFVCYANPLTSGTRRAVDLHVADTAAAFFAGCRTAEAKALAQFFIGGSLPSTPARPLLLLRLCATRNATTSTWRPASRRDRSLSRWHLPLPRPGPLTRNVWIGQSSRAMRSACGWDWRSAGPRRSAPVSGRPILLLH